MSLSPACLVSMSNYSGSHANPTPYYPYSLLSPRFYSSLAPAGDRVWMPYLFFLDQVQVTTTQFVHVETTDTKCHQTVACQRRDFSDTNEPMRYDAALQYGTVYFSTSKDQRAWDIPNRGG